MNNSCNTSSEQPKAVIYARYSSHGQQEQSIDGQLRDCYAYADRQGYSVIAEYIDRALTGRNDDRPDFQRMLADARKRQFKYIIVWKLDRFARNRYDSAVHKAELNRVEKIRRPRYIRNRKHHGRTGRNNA